MQEKSVKMTRYEKHMQHIHNKATAMSIEMAVELLIDDIVECLIKSGVKHDASLLKDIRKLSHYQYNPQKQINE